MTGCRRDGRGAAGRRLGRSGSKCGNLRLLLNPEVGSAVIACQSEGGAVDAPVPECDFWVSGLSVDTGSPAVEPPLFGVGLGDTERRTRPD